MYSVVNQNICICVCVCVCVCPCSRYVKFKVSWNYGKGFEVSWIMERTLNMCVCVCVCVCSKVNVYNTFVIFDSKSFP
jgi:hypothetical protein